MTAEEIFDQILKKRRIKNKSEFLNPDYSRLSDPLKLPDIKPALDRLKKAQKNQEQISIYGDYDIDGLTATTILKEALELMGFEKVDAYIPDRFSEGYGLSDVGIKAIAETGSSLIITVDCGSRSIDEINLAKELGLDMIVTDHHEVGDTLPKCVAVINPKRSDSKYPFRDLAGVGVAFGLIRALQTELSGLPAGHEKWLLDMVALGTVCDVVELLGENRILVANGLKVFAKSRRAGLVALAEVSDVNLDEVDPRALGFRFGPRLNAAGRLEHANSSLEILSTRDRASAQELADKLDGLNQQRRLMQDQIFKEAAEQAKQFENDPVLVLSGRDWSQGINGIVASRLVEMFKKPVFVLQEIEDRTKGSARSFGEFNLAEAIDDSRKLLISGGGHAAAGGVTFRSTNLEKFRKSINDYHKKLDLKDQSHFLVDEPDLSVDSFEGLDENLLQLINQLAPFGFGHKPPAFLINDLNIDSWKRVGADQRHAKLTLVDKNGESRDAIGFGLADQIPPGATKLSTIFRLEMNHFNGRSNLQHQIIAIV